MADLSEGVDPRFKEDVRIFIKEQAKLLYCSLGRMEARLVRARNLSRRFREAAGRRRTVAIERLAKPAARLVRHNKRLRGLSDDDLFGIIVDREDFLRFFSEADKEVRLAEERPPKVEPISAATPPAENGAAAGDAAIAADGGEAATAPKMPDLLDSKEEAERWLADQMASELLGSGETPAAAAAAGAEAQAPAAGTGGAESPSPEAAPAVAALAPAAAAGIGLAADGSAATTPVEPALPLGPETERVEFSPEDATRLFALLLAQENEGVDEDDEPTGVLHRDTLLERLLPG